MQRVADEAMALVAGAEGVLIGLVHDEWLTFECAAGYLEEQVGQRAPLQGSLSGLAIRTDETLRCDDAESDSRVELDLCHAFRVVSTVCVPLRRGNQAVGILSVSSSRPRAFDDRDVATLTSLAEFVSVVIAAACDLAGVTDTLLSRARRDRLGTFLPDGNTRAAEERFVANVLSPGVLGGLETKSRVERFLSGRGLAHVFQPVFDVTSGELFGVEALARFSARPKRTPDIWFADAHAMGIGVTLEVASVKEALASLSHLPEDIALCINAGPEAMASDEVLQLLRASDSRRIVMELTEQVKVDDYPRLSCALKQLRLMGVRLAIDDTGAGFASLAHILKLAPDIIKLDRELVSGIDHDPVRGALAAALVTFAGKTGAEIIAEGIETAAEFEVVRGLGIRYGQGYFLCRPTSAQSIPNRLAREVLSGSATRAS
jgi:EAL domain-containing protein (putative c-di-GMP-specific phosphodiesterase class I)